MLRPFLALLLLTTAALAAEKPTLTDAERAAGWQLLFDGESLNGWKPLGTAPGNGNWTAAEGEIQCAASGPGGKHNDLITAKQYENFELTWEWRIQEKGNSGVKYNLPDASKNVGCEYQLLDDNGHPDAAKHEGTRKTGGLYDVIAPAADKKLNPPGQWNQSRILVKAGHVEHFLNGGKTVEFQLGSPELAQLVAQSKFSKTVGWGKLTSSPLLLQDHGDSAAFRNLKIRELK